MLRCWSKEWKTLWIHQFRGQRFRPYSFKAPSVFSQRCSLLEARVGAILTSDVYQKWVDAEVNSCSWPGWDSYTLQRNSWWLRECDDDQTARPTVFFERDVKDLWNRYIHGGGLRICSGCRPIARRLLAIHRSRSELGSCYHYQQH